MLERLPAPLFSRFFPCLEVGSVSFPLCGVSLRLVNPLFICFSWKLTSCRILMTPGPEALTKMLNIRSLSVISQHFWRGRGVQALALKPPVCLWSSDDALKPSPLSCRRCFFPGFLPPSLWENRAPELNPAVLPFLPPRSEPTPAMAPPAPISSGSEPRWMSQPRLAARREPLLFPVFPGFPSGFPVFFPVFPAGFLGFPAESGIKISICR